jgi:hypothetical protein
MISRSFDRRIWKLNLTMYNDTLPYMQKINSNRRLHRFLSKWRLMSAKQT